MTSNRAATGTEGTVKVNGQVLRYSEFGRGNRVVVLHHAVLTSKRMEEAWAAALADKGFRVICVDLLGSTDNGAPLELDRYSSEAFGTQVLGVMDALGIEIAVLGGTSLGANVSIEAALAAPDRVVALLLEGPFLEDGISKAALLWSLGVGLFTIGRPVVRLAGLAARVLPDRGAGSVLGLLRDVLTADPARSAAFMQGLMIGRIAPPRELRRSIAVPTFIMSMTADPVHPASDAHRLAADILGSQVVPVGTLATLRLWPRRVAPAAISFLTEVWGTVENQPVVDVEGGRSR